MGRHKKVVVWGLGFLVIGVWLVGFVFQQNYQNLFSWHCSGHNPCSHSSVLTKVSLLPCSLSLPDDFYPIYAKCYYSIFVSLVLIFFLIIKFYPTSCGRICLQLSFSNVGLKNKNLRRLLFTSTLFVPTWELRKMR